MLTLQNPCLLGLSFERIVLLDYKTNILIKTQVTEDLLQVCNN